MHAHIIILMHGGAELLCCVVLVPVLCCIPLFALRCVVSMSSKCCVE